MFSIKITFENGRLFVKDQEVKGVKKALVFTLACIAMLAGLTVVLSIILAFVGLTIAIITPIIAIGIPILIFVVFIMSILNLFSKKRKD